MKKPKWYRWLRIVIKIFVKVLREIIPTQHEFWRNVKSVAWLRTKDTFWGMLPIMLLAIIIDYWNLLDINDDSDRYLFMVLSISLGLSVWLFRIKKGWSRL